jgi:protein-tyrosine phosphatase
MVTEMIMDPSSNRLILPNLYNARDMGGMRTSSGVETAFRRFIRSDSPSALNADSIESLIEYSVRTVIDLRSKQEIDRTGNPFREHPEIQFHNIPLITSDPDDLSDPTMKHLVKNRLGDLYIFMLEHSQKSVRKVLEAIIHAPDGAIVFHCMHGKDRTGLIAALLYLLAGVSQHDIIENYASSFDNIRPLVDPLFKITPRHTHHIYRSDAENMKILLQHMDHTYEGRADPYLVKIGLTEQDVESLRNRMF